MDYNSNHQIPSTSSTAGPGRLLLDDLVYKLLMRQKVTHLMLAVKRALDPPPPLLHQLILWKDHQI